jgi:diphosphomevalonate decarboxylase
VSGDAVCRAGPSLALTKYWGKAVKGENLPATPSLAVTLGGVHSETRAWPDADDSVTVDGVPQEPARSAPFFDTLRKTLGTTLHFRALSTNTFPTSAGMASSSSGFAALAGACARAAGVDAAASDLSAIARVGSASAARAVFGGFVLLPAGARRARPLFGPGHWPELRILVAITHRGAKPVSSRRAMEDTRASSPYYFSWIKESAAILPDALRALEDRDLEVLGECARRSYSLMHAAILGARPSLLFWLPATVAVIHACAALRGRGIGAWETIDAGPQVKVLCLAKDLAAVTAGLQELDAGIQLIPCHPGEGLRYPAEEIRGVPRREDIRGTPPRGEG